jgi:hypothetical protein
MYDLNGRLQQPQRIPKRGGWSNRANLVLMKLLEVPLPVRLAFWLTLLVLVTLLAGCATQSPPDAWPKNPQPPQLTEPIPTESYSSKAQRLIESWLQRATGM